MIKRKQRTRQHVIASMSLHHVAYTVVKCGYTLEATQSDYGYDGLLFTYGDTGEVENGNIFVQLKATDNIAKYRKQTSFCSAPAKRTSIPGKPSPFLST